ncbi:BolA family transcriptional regulator [Candidatus Binatia bacterium]|nr:BolA family transcriptional regulator [Candidatus Binatia bacterium]
MNTAAIAAVLRAAFAPETLHVDDDSHLHAGHAGAAGGGGHFRVRIVAAAFRGQSRVARHRAVYVALGDAMRRDIHALAIEALTPEEAAARQEPPEVLPGSERHSPARS